MNINDELMSLKNDDKASFVESLLEKECPLKSLGIPIPVIRKMSKKYSAEDVKDIDLNRYTEANIHYLLVMLKTLNLEQQVSFHLENPDLYKSWAITDTIQSEIRIKTAKDIGKILPLKEKSSYSRRLFYVILMRFRQQWNEISSYIEDDERREVYMAVAWLLQGCYVYHPDEVLDHVSSFSPVTKRVLLSKIRDSRQINKDDKKKASDFLKRS